MQEKNQEGGRYTTEITTMGYVLSILYLVAIHGIVSWEWLSDYVGENRVWIVLLALSVVFWFLFIKKCTYLKYRGK